MKKILNALLVCTAIFITSCNDNSETIENPQSYSAELKAGLKTFTKTASSTNQASTFLRSSSNSSSNSNSSSLCFEFNFPLSVVDTDGNEFLVNNYLEMFSTENLSDFVYPITVTKNGEIITINSGSDFDSLFNECYNIDDCVNCPENCFEIVYPLNLVSSNGTNTTVNNDSEFNTFIDGLNQNEYFTIAYPLNIVLADGTQQSINSDEEFIDVIENCI